MKCILFRKKNEKHISFKSIMSVIYCQAYYAIHIYFAIFKHIYELRNGIKKLQMYQFKSEKNVFFEENVFKRNGIKVTIGN